MSWHENICTSFIKISVVNMMNSYLVTNLHINLLYWYPKMDLTCLLSHVLSYCRTSSSITERAAGDVVYNSSTNTHHWGFIRCTRLVLRNGFLGVCFDEHMVWSSCDKWFHQEVAVSVTCNPIMLVVTIACSLNIDTHNQGSDWF